MPTLFDPISLGALSAPNRILMAPMSRSRATRDHLPTAIMAEYYAQRASAGLIISEAIGISRQGLGWPYAPGIWSDEQVEAWKPITKAVHDRGGRISAQLWHMGRMAHSSVTGEQPVSASATATPGEAHTYAGKKPHEVANPLRVYRDVLEGLQPARIRHVHPAILRLELVEGRRGDAVLAADIHCGSSSLLLLQRPDNLLFHES